MFQDQAKSEKILDWSKLVKVNKKGNPLVSHF